LLFLVHGYLSNGYRPDSAREGAARITLSAGIFPDVTIGTVCQSVSMTSTSSQLNSRSLRGEKRRGEERALILPRRPPWKNEIKNASN
jgi:hypothetical protein